MGRRNPFRKLLGLILIILGLLILFVGVLPARFWWFFVGVGLAAGGFVLFFKR